MRRPQISIVLSFVAGICVALPFAPAGSERPRTAVNHTSEPTAESAGRSPLWAAPSPTPSLRPSRSAFRAPAPLRPPASFTPSSVPAKAAPTTPSRRALADLRRRRTTKTPAPARRVAIAPGRGGLNWRALRDCESSNNYRKLNPSGRYRGAYQFDRPTWQSVGGVGDPAAASPAEQDKRAWLLFLKRGRAPWPECGRLL